MISGQQSGYTIVEALIFIAVSSLLFFSAMTAIGGRQQQVQFTQAVRSFDTQLRDVMNDVTTGFFPGLNTVSCVVPNNAPANVRPSLSVPGPDDIVDQGTSNSCVFVGKAMQFGPEVDGEVKNDRFLLHSIVGRRTDENLQNVTGIADANPVAVAPTSTSDPLGTFTDEVILDWGLRVNRVVVIDDSGSTQFGTLGLFNTFSDTQSADPQSESQLVDLGPIPGTDIGDSSFEAVSFINRVTDTPPLLSSGGITEQLIDNMNPSGGVVLCLSDPDQGREASITLSSSNRRLTTDVTFDQVDEAICG